jgi:predicted nucleic acid-binding protein
VILVDTSVWIDHLRSGDEVLAGLLDDGRVLTHPFVIGEIAVGNLRRRELVLGLLHDLPFAPSATDSETLGFIDRYALAGRGIGYVDAHLLASTHLVAAGSFWTRDKRLDEVARSLGVAAKIS